MIGQSVVQTGSRKVSSTTLPRRPASDTWRPSWLVRVKLGAGVSSWPDAPAMASAMIGSASWLTEANAIGAAPTRITAIAASATAARPPDAASDSRSRSGWSAAGTQDGIGRGADADGGTGGAAPDPPPASTGEVSGVAASAAAWSTGAAPSWDPPTGSGPADAAALAVTCCVAVPATAWAVASRPWAVAMAAPSAATAGTVTAAWAVAPAAETGTTPAGMVAGAGCGVGVRASQPAVNSRISGIMLLGSVPSPPKNPRSSISTQSARHSTVPAITPARASRASLRAAAAQNTAPSPATAITA